MGWTSGSKRNAGSNRLDKGEQENSDGHGLDKG